MTKQRKRRNVEIEHPHIREVDERTLHPGIEQETEQDLKSGFTDNEVVNTQVQG